MRAILHEVTTAAGPEALAWQVRHEPGLVLLRSGWFESARARYSFVATRPMLTFRSFGARCESTAAGYRVVQYGNPWPILESLIARYELRGETDLPFPLGGCFGYWGYDLKDFIEPTAARRGENDLRLPGCQAGFHGNLVVFDHRLQKTWIVATGLALDGSRSAERARKEVAWWTRMLNLASANLKSQSGAAQTCMLETHGPVSTLSRWDYIARVQRAQDYIRAGHIYQVNLSHRLRAALPPGRRRAAAWQVYEGLSQTSPAPFSAFLDCGSFQLVSASPEQFLQMSGSRIETRPIKGTRPRAPEPERDAQLAFQLQSSPKELAELVMITDLLRNDLGRVCEYGSVRVPDLAKLERYAHVQHLVSTVEGSLRSDVTHLAALASCFPGGSITGAPKVRAMQIIDELEPVARGPYTGALGYLGFNRESQLSIIIRSVICKDQMAYAHVGAGIVADSVPEAEYEETLAKATGFLRLIGTRHEQSRRVSIPAHCGHFTGSGTYPM